MVVSLFSRLKPLFSIAVEVAGIDWMLINRAGALQKGKHCRLLETRRSYRLSKADRVCEEWS